MILAAGKGERLSPLTDTCHKALVPVPGGPTLGRWLDLFRDAQRVVVNVHHLAADVIAYAQAHRPDVVISHERVLLESGGGVRHVLPYFDQPFWVVNSDIFGDVEAMRTTLEGTWHNQEGMRLLLVPTPDTHPGDYDMAPDGRLTYRRGGPYTAGGLSIACPSVYKSFPDGMIFSNRLVWDELEVKSLLYGTVFEGSWIDIGTYDRLRQTGWQD